MIIIKDKNARGIMLAILSSWYRMKRYVMEILVSMRSKEYIYRLFEVATVLDKIQGMNRFEFKLKLILQS